MTESCKTAKHVNGQVSDRLYADTKSHKPAVPPTTGSLFPRNSLLREPKGGQGFSACAGTHLARTERFSSVQEKGEKRTVLTVMIAYNGCLGSHGTIRSEGENFFLAEQLSVRSAKPQGHRSAEPRDHRSAEQNSGQTAGSSIPTGPTSRISCSHGAYCSLPPYAQRLA